MGGIPGCGERRLWLGARGIASVRLVQRRGQTREQTRLLAWCELIAGVCFLTGGILNLPAGQNHVLGWWFTAVGAFQLCVGIYCFVRYRRSEN